MVCHPVTEVGSDPYNLLPQLRTDTLISYRDSYSCRKAVPSVVVSLSKCVILGPSGSQLEGNLLFYVSISLRLTKDYWTSHPGVFRIVEELASFSLTHLGQS